MKFYITTPIYYVNDLPHIGHAYTSIAADVIARWNKLLGKDVFFLTGTDEHGAKIAQAAQREGKSPKEFCDIISESFKIAWKDLNINYDFFIRTTDLNHENSVKEFIQILFNSGNIYKKSYEGLYCIQCEKFLTESDLDENLCCPDHKQKPILHSEENYFFRLSSYRDILLDIISNEKHPQHIAIFPIERRNEIIGKLKLGLEDISISRAHVEWGIPLPFDNSQTAYVWIDALLNYLTGIGYGYNQKLFDTYWPADLHLMAKDILWFHSVIWPSILMAANLPLPKTISAHGFFTINGEKMSKTLGNIIKPNELIQRYGVDATRYLLLSLFPFGSDGDISYNILTEKYNTELANNLGNLILRTLTMINKYFNGKIPPINNSTPSEQIIDISQILKVIPEYMEKLQFHSVIDTIQKAIDKSNRLIEINAPWKMAKENNPALPNILNTLIQSIGIICFYLIPFMPEVTKRIWHSIGETEPIEKIAALYIKTQDLSNCNFPHSGRSIIKGDAIFPRIVS